MLYFTGDMHGDKSRFGAWRLRWLGARDTLVICGDFGFLWNGSQEEREVLEWIGRRKYQVLFLEGTHDNLDLLDSYPVEEWNGGLTHHISGNLRHLIRGEVFTIGDRTLLAIGGGESRDAAFRKAGENWWARELPTLPEVEEWARRLEERGGRVDFVVSHRPPPTWIPASPARSVRSPLSPPLWTASSSRGSFSAGSSAPIIRTGWCRLNTTGSLSGWNGRSPGIHQKEGIADDYTYSKRRRSHRRPRRHRLASGLGSRSGGTHCKNGGGGRPGPGGGLAGH